MTADNADIEFARDLARAHELPAHYVPPDCPRIVITIPLEGPVDVDVQGDMDRLFNWLKGREGHVATISGAIRLAREGRGE
jgi:hypothetical protein